MTQKLHPKVAKRLALVAWERLIQNPEVAKAALDEIIGRLKKRPDEAIGLVKLGVSMIYSGRPLPDLGWVDGVMKQLLARKGRRTGTIWSDPKLIEAVSQGVVQAFDRPRKKRQRKG